MIHQYREELKRIQLEDDYITEEDLQDILDKDPVVIVTRRFLKRMDTYSKKCVTIDEKYVRVDGYIIGEIDLGLLNSKSRSAIKKSRSGKGPDPRVALLRNLIQLEEKQRAIEELHACPF